MGRNPIPSGRTVTSSQAMNTVWKRRPRLNARPHPMAIASAANEDCRVRLISMVASTYPRVQAAIGTPGQSRMSRFSGLSGRKVIDTFYGSCPSQPESCEHKRVAASSGGRNGGFGLHVEFADVQVAQF